MEKNQFINLVVEIATEVASRVYDERINGSLFIQDPQPEEVEEKKPKKAQRSRRTYKARAKHVEIHNLGRRFGLNVPQVRQYCSLVGVSTYVIKGSKHTFVTNEDAMLLAKVIQNLTKNTNEE